MPIAFVVALAVSLGIHVAVLFGSDIEFFGGGEEPLPLRVELKPPPSPPPPAVATPKAVDDKLSTRPQTKTTKPKRPTRHKPSPVVDVTPPKAIGDKPTLAIEDKPPETVPDLPTFAETPPASQPSTPVQPAAKPLLPSAGTIRFVIYYGTRGFQVGRAEHHWEFTADGRYRLSGMTETVGIAALFKPLLFENESSGRLVAGGLRPDSYRTRKNGRDANENADFSWPAGEVRLSRSGNIEPVTPGTQDILSLNYQLAYLKRPENGVTVGVVNGKKYDRFALDALGEEDLDIPAGHFRTLHLRATGDTVTEIWIALDRDRLPVKIRYTDKKGDIFEQVATEIGSP